MNTCSVPLRGSTQRAVRTICRADWPRVTGTLRTFTPGRGCVSPSRDACSKSRRAASGERGANGSRSSSVSVSSGADHGKESSGSRKPIGESPGRR